MPKIAWRLRDLRLHAAAHRRRPLSVREAAEEITVIMKRHAEKRAADGEDIDPEKTAMGRVRLTNLELGGAAGIGEIELLAICEYYAGIFDRPISTSEVMEYDPNNKRALVQPQTTIMAAH